MIGLPRPAPPVRPALSPARPEHDAPHASRFASRPTHSAATRTSPRPRGRLIADVSRLSFGVAPLLSRPGESLVESLVESLAKATQRAPCACGSAVSVACLSASATLSVATLHACRPRGQRRMSTGGRRRGAGRPAAGGKGLPLPRACLPGARIVFRRETRGEEALPPRRDPAPGVVWHGCMSSLWSPSQSPLLEPGRGPAAGLCRVAAPRSWPDWGRPVEEPRRESPFLPLAEPAIIPTRSAEIVRGGNGPAERSHANRRKDGRVGQEYGPSPLSRCPPPQRVQLSPRVSVWGRSPSANPSVTPGFTFLPCPLTHRASCTATQRAAVRPIP